jgi:murein L,D-transpeptidase YcbB/YkuD
MNVSLIVRVLVSCFLWLGLAQGLQADVRDEIFDMVEAVSVAEEDYLLADAVGAPELIESFYHDRDYRAAWEGREQVDAVLAFLGASSDHGLDPDDYHYRQLQKFMADWDSRKDRSDRNHARFDVLLTDGVLLYARHIQEGKVDPSKMEESWNYTRRDFSREKTLGKLSAALEQGNVVEALQSLAPKKRFYQLLQAELKHYREMDAAGDLMSVPTDVVLKPGEKHENITLLRSKLEQMGYAKGAAVADTAFFDDQLKASVEAFQTMHSLDADGVVGKDSFAELNKSYGQRIDQLRINLDRVRWVDEDAGGDLIMVNVAGFELYFFRDNQLSWETDVMVGTIQNQTPFFQSRMKYLVLNPTWTIPYSIIRNSTFAKFKKDPNYALEHNFKLYDTDGAEVDPLSIDYSKYSPGRFPFRVVQQPGPNNALGRVKFIFANKYAVYLHDTPSKELFSRTSRAFSHGCIRVENPLYFAEILLNDEQQWNRAAIDAVIEGGQQKVVHLQEPLDVMLMYWTASPTTEGGIQFHADVYDRDAKTIAALKEKPRWDVN